MSTSKRKGTATGECKSPFLFNIFADKLVEEVNEKKTIGNMISMSDKEGTI